MRHAHVIPWWAPLCLAGSMALVGSYVGLSRVLVMVFPVFLLAWLRFGMAAVAMLPWLRRGPGEPALSEQDRRLLFWESFFGNFLFSILMLWGIQRSTAVNAGVVMASIPAAVALLSWWVLNERPSRKVMLGMACAMAGMVVLALVRQGHEVGSASRKLGWGELALLGAVFCEAFYVVIGKRLTGQVSPKRISALVNLWGLALITPLGLWQVRGFDFSAVSGQHWGLLVFYALAASMITVWLWMTGLRHVPASTAGVYTVMLPLSAAAVGVGILNEPFTPAHGWALGLGLIGVWLVGLAPSTPRPTTQLDAVKQP